MVLDLQGSYVACLYSGDGGFFFGFRGWSGNCGAAIHSKASLVLGYSFDYNPQLRTQDSNEVKQAKTVSIMAVLALGINV